MADPVELVDDQEREQRTREAEDHRDQVDHERRHDQAVACARSRTPRGSPPTRCRRDRSRIGGIGCRSQAATNMQPIDARSIAYATVTLPSAARDHQSGEQRSEEAGGVPHDLVQRLCGRQLRGSEDPGGDRRSGGAVQRAARGEHGEARVDQPQRWLAGDRAAEQGRRAGGEADLGEHQEPSSGPRRRGSRRPRAIPPRARGDRRARWRRPPPRSP